MPLRHKTVAVGVIYDQERKEFLLFHNPKWDKFAFCMKKPTSGLDPAEVALVALDEDSHVGFPDASARPLATVGAVGVSGSVGEETYYDYHVFEVRPGAADGAPDPGQARYYTYNQLQAAEEVSWSTKEIARSLVEFQEASVAVITRRIDGERHFLLVDNPSYGYFLPSARRKTQSPPEMMAENAARWDLAYEGEIRARWCKEVSDIHVSTRFGNNQREFRFHLCPTHFPGVDLAADGNPVQTAVDAFGDARREAGQALGSRGYWGWFAEADLSTDPEVSKTLDAIVKDVVHCADQMEAD